MFIHQLIQLHSQPVFEKMSKIQKLYVQLCGHTTFVLLKPACIMTIIDKNHNILQWCKQKHFHRITCNKDFTLYVKKK